jgi:hypothetical protein
MPGKPWSRASLTAGAVEVEFSCVLPPLPHSIVGIFTPLFRVTNSSAANDTDEHKQKTRQYTADAIFN